MKRRLRAIGAHAAPKAAHTADGRRPPPPASGPAAGAQPAATDSRDAPPPAGGRIGALREQARLYKFLMRLSPEERRAALAGCFSQQQRLALEKWILQERSKAAAPAAGRAGAASSRAKRRRHLRNGGPPSVGAGGLRGGEVRAAVGAEKARLGGCCSGSPVASLRRRCCHRRRSRTVALSDSTLPLSGCRSVHKKLKNRRVSYCASVSAGPFKLDTSYFEDLVLVLRFREVLKDIRAQVSCAGSDKDRAEQLLREQIAELPQRSGLRPEDMGLRFSVCLAAGFWVGRSLRSPQFAVATELDTGLEAWRRLEAARSAVYRGPGNRRTILVLHSLGELQAAWAVLRDVYIDIWVSAGTQRSRVVARLRSLEERHAAACCLEAAEADSAALVGAATTVAAAPAAVSPGSEPPRRRAGPKLHGGACGPTAAQELLRLLARWSTIDRGRPKAGGC